MKKSQEKLITHQPDVRVDLETPYFLCSSSGKFDTERLTFFVEQIYPIWYENNFSLHQLADYLKPLNISLYTDDKVEKIAQEKAREFSFWLRFHRDYPGEILIQCRLTDSESMH